MAARRVLVIEDDPGARDALGSLLADDGLVVRTAASGRRALECIRDFRPDVVVCDFYLPDLNGLQILRHLRQMPGKVFFIMLTAGGGGEEVQRALREEADLFLNKPVDLARLRRVLGLDRMPDPALPRINALN
jgi:CheY-like chemotaxis protein